MYLKIRHIPVIEISCFVHESWCNLHFDGKLREMDLFAKNIFCLLVAFFYFILKMHLCYRKSCPSMRHVNTRRVCTSVLNELNRIEFNYLIHKIPCFWEILMRNIQLGIPQQTIERVRQCIICFTHQISSFTILNHIHICRTVAQLRQQSTSP